MVIGNPRQPERPFCLHNSQLSAEIVIVHKFHPVLPALPQNYPKYPQERRLIGIKISELGFIALHQILFTIFRH